MCSKSTEFTSIFYTFVILVKICQRNDQLWDEAWYAITDSPTTKHTHVKIINMFIISEFHFTSKSFVSTDLLCICLCKQHRYSQRIGRGCATSPAANNNTCCCQKVFKINTCCASLAELKSCLQFTCMSYVPLGKII